MPFNANVYKVLIASPSDLKEERKLITNAINNWNAINSEEYLMVLLPVKWETHSYPELGDRPQGLLNKQFVNSCDILIGSFWTRIGSPTGVAESGTIEEIELMRSYGKMVMLYFSSLPVELNSIDFKQLEALTAYKNSLMSKGLLETYGSLSELEKKITDHLTFVVRTLQIKKPQSSVHLSQLAENYYEKWREIKEDSPSAVGIKDFLSKFRDDIENADLSKINGQEFLLTIKDAQSFIITDIDSQRRLCKVIDAIFSELNDTLRKVG